MSQSGTEVQSKLGQWETEIETVGREQARQAVDRRDESKLKAHDGSIDGMQTSLKELKSSERGRSRPWLSRRPSHNNSRAIDQQVSNSCRSSAK